MRIRWDDILQYIIMVALFGMILFTLIGCKSIKPVVLPNHHTDIRDSARKEYIHDSIYIDRWHTEYQKGDTIYIRDSVWRDRWRNKEIHDSIYINTTDTIYQPVEIVKEQSKFLRNSGIALWILIALLVAGVVIGIILKIKK